MTEVLADGTVVGQLILLIATLAGAAGGIWKQGQTAKNALKTAEMHARHQMDLLRLQHEMEVSDRREKALLDKEERQRLAVKVDETGTAVKNQLDASALNVNQRLDQSAVDVRDRLTDAAERVREQLGVAQADERTHYEDVLAKQTETIAAEIQGAAALTVAKADAAYHEANSVNVKLEKLHKAHEQQGKVIRDLLEKLTKPDEEM